jgi:hypothetical protein
LDRRERRYRRGRGEMHPNPWRSPRVNAEEESGEGDDHARVLATRIGNLDSIDRDLAVAPSANLDLETSYLERPDVGASDHDSAHNRVLAVRVNVGGDHVWSFRVRHTVHSASAMRVVVPARKSRGRKRGAQSALHSAPFQGPRAK